MDEKLRILLCEDDENLGMLLREYLQAKGYSADLFPDGETGFKAFLKNKYDLVVTDVMMPKKDGFTLAQEIRQANAEIPIIFLTAKTLKEDILEGFKIGADDYISKPFSIREVIARVKAVLRRIVDKEDPAILQFEKLYIDPVKKRAFIDSTELPLTKKEFEILSLLLSHPGQVFSREEILSKIWTDEVYVLDRTIDVNITRLRKKIGEYGKRIVTRLGYGYCFETA